MPVRKLPELSPDQVLKLLDALLANADRLLVCAQAVLDQEDVGLARSLAILGMEESGKAIALHERRVEIAYAPEGEPFVNARLENLWASHQQKLELVHSFLVEERYWFGVRPADPETNREYLGAIKGWTRRHDKLKLRGFYVDIDKAGNVLGPAEVSDRDTLAEVISHVHQIGWQLRLGEHIEAKQQAEASRDVPPYTAAEAEKMRDVLSGISEASMDAEFYEAMRQGREGRELHNDGYRIKLPEPGTNPFENLGKPGYEAQTRELMWLAEELDSDEG